MEYLEKKISTISPQMFQKYNHDYQTYGTFKNTNRKRNKN